MCKHVADVGSDSQVVIALPTAVKEVNRSGSLDSLLSGSDDISNINRL